LEAIDIPQFSKLHLTWPDLSIYIIQPALANKPDIEEITNYPIGAGADKPYIEEITNYPIGAGADKPDIEEITNYPIGAGVDKFEILLQTLHHFPFTGKFFRLQHYSMLIQDRRTLFDVWCVHDVIYAVDPNDDKFVASF